MSEATILDRLARAMQTLGKREGKALTPRQRVAAAQRWNSLAGIGEGELDRLYDLSARTDRTGEIAASRYATLDYDMRDFGLKARNSENRADNPFLSDNIDKYREQSDFLDWCRYNRVEPNARSLKQFRWERYKEMGIPQRIRIHDNYDPYFIPEVSEENMWYSQSDMPDYLPVGWDESSNWRY